ncbi:hypothetical protein P5P86_06045 [Nocardioides sp. BP30]|uniref:hypothetical protein n=1 Tax=Nocardioides sp. BP30 TaxID=3036374 RepID=UPI0024699B44|nr:hypothetical protein [Nocardioides sp. BP30]WGL53387.1 hypothetical protein P5P86_06045 [Nocardioides sp. BP30]
MRDVRRRLGPLGWTGVCLTAVAVLVVVFAVVAAHRTTDGPSVRLSDGAHHLSLPAHRTYGIYVDDADNSGYSETCSATDDRGGSIRMRDSSWSISSSDTEMLDLVYDTGSGDLVLTCSVPGEIVTTRPVPANALVLLGVAGVAVGIAGIVLVIVGLSRRRRDVPAPTPGQVRRSRGGSPPRSWFALGFLLAGIVLAFSAPSRFTMPLLVVTALLSQHIRDGEPRDRAARAGGAVFYSCVAVGVVLHVVLYPDRHPAVVMWSVIIVGGVVSVPVARRFSTVDAVP